MSTLIQAISDNRKQLVKEISGLVTILGSNINESSEQQGSPAMSHFGTAEVQVIHLQEVFPEVHAKKHTNQLDRIMAFKGEPEKLLGLTYTWSKVENILLDDLIEIHKALSARLDIILHRD